MLAIETQVFATDRLSRRSFRRLVGRASAAVLVAEADGQVRGAAVVLFRPNSATARLYSIAVDPAARGRGIGPTLLDATEQEAAARGCGTLRLEVHDNNARAIARYRKAGFREFGRRLAYYQDHGDALLFRKNLVKPFTGPGAPPYFHQTTPFTCAPACMLMALAWADPSFRPLAAMEFRLWREATTIPMSSGAGGCDPFGIAVALKAHGLMPEIFVSRPGPYFLENVRSSDYRRAMRVIQDDFVQQAAVAGIAAHVTGVDATALAAALADSAVAIVLVGGRSKQPRWVFAFGHADGDVLLHDPAAAGDDGSVAIPLPAFMRLSTIGREKFAATLLVRKGPPS